jgi:dihydropteroate synthase
MRAVLDLGADIVNDIWALRQPGAIEAIAAHRAGGVCLMHMHRDPQTMQTAPMMGDVVPAVRAFLDERAQTLLELGVDASRIVLDPGIGFGKTVEQNFALLARQRELLVLGPAACRMVTQIFAGRGHRHRAAGERMVPSVAAGRAGRRAGRVDPARARCARNRCRLGGMARDETTTGTDP